MPCDPARRAAIQTKATVLLVSAGILRRQLHRRDDLSGEAEAWLETRLETLMETAHELARLATDEGEPGASHVIEGVPTAYLVTLARVSRN